VNKLEWERDEEWSLAWGDDGFVAEIYDDDDDGCDCYRVNVWYVDEGGYWLDDWPGWVNYKPRCYFPTLQLAKGAANAALEQWMAPDNKVRLKNNSACGG
jgi:hypothetical protein